MSTAMFLCLALGLLAVKAATARDVWHCPSDHCVRRVASGDAADAHVCVLEPGAGYQCGGENGAGAVCQCDGYVKYGDYISWSNESESNTSINCSSDIFGDPAMGKPKFCWCRPRSLVVANFSTKAVAVWNEALGQAAKTAFGNQGYIVTAEADCVNFQGSVTVPNWLAASFGEGFIRWIVAPVLQQVLNSSTVGIVKVEAGLEFNISANAKTGADSLAAMIAKVDALSSPSNIPALQETIIAVMKPYGAAAGLAASVTKVSFVSFADPAALSTSRSASTSKSPQAAALSGSVKSRGMALAGLASMAVMLLMAVHSVNWNI
ncbi:unnamed protein product [Polarella glacialis]|uniref:Uncharacterized protein n=1 Tax=Polarella glacialis TaxID=89957 RepID=A0A813LI49_POLGL|nr:unnamed protein product [Polarella glacialis]